MTGEVMLDVGGRVCHYVEPLLACWRALTTWKVVIKLNKAPSLGGRGKTQMVLWEFKLGRRKGK